MKHLETLFDILSKAIILACASGAALFILWGIIYIFVSRLN